MTEVRSVGEQATVLSSQRWRRLIPIAFVTYSLAYLDRSNYSIGVAGGLKEDLGITAGWAGLLGALFFAGYFIFQIPAAIYAEKRSVRRLIFWTVLLWGVFATAQGFIPWLWLLMIDRFALGIVEAAVIPAMLIFLMHWFSKRERGRANTFLILGNPITVMWLSAASGYLIEATSWRAMFILEGIPAIIWAFVFRAMVQDHPQQAHWLNEAEKTVIVDRLEHEQEEIAPVSGYAEAFRSRNVVVLSAQYLLWSVGVYGFVFWLPTILKAGSDRGIGAIGALSAVPYAAAAIAMLVVSNRSDKSGNRRDHVWPYLLGATVLFAGSVAIGEGSFWLSYVLLIGVGACIYAPYGPYFAYIPEFLPQNVAGASMALINSAGALGGFVGAYAVGWIQGSVGNAGAYVFMGVCLGLSALLMFPVRPRPAEPARPATEVRSSPKSRTA